MTQTETIQIERWNGINDLSNEDWLKKTSSIRLTPEQKERFLKIQPYLHQLRKTLMELYGPEFVESVIGDIAPSLVFYPAVMPGNHDLAHPATFDEREIIAIMINEEDHLRIQVMQSGFNLFEAFNIIGQIDEVLAKQVHYAFSPEWDI